MFLVENLGRLRERRLVFSHSRDFFIGDLEPAICDA